jgi:hypothetical protein
MKRGVCGLPDSCMVEVGLHSVSYQFSQGLSPKNKNVRRYGAVPW